VTALGLARLVRLALDYLAHRCYLVYLALHIVMSLRRNDLYHTQWYLFRTVQLELHNYSQNRTLSDPISQLVFINAPAYTTPEIAPVLALGVILMSAESLRHSSSARRKCLPPSVDSQQWDLSGHPQLHRAVKTSAPFLELQNLRAP
jgi:hypothetical protein